MHPEFPEEQLAKLADQIRLWGRDAGFQQVGITDTALESHEEHLKAWLDAGYAGEMAWMGAHGNKRSRPGELMAGTQRVISFRMDYLPEGVDPVTLLESPGKAYISRYTLGRDYHKLVRKRLATIGKKIEEAVGGEQRAFVDSAPVLERALAEKSGLGWIGKNTMLINSKAGSWFFLGEIYTSLPLPVDEPDLAQHCGSCSACLEVCPTDAFVGPWELDARRCISYLTIELKGPIPEELRSKMGNRIFGCDDCQLVCPWNKFSGKTTEEDFQPRHQLDDRELAELFLWDEEAFLVKTEGSAIRRIGHERWLRNIAVALGNAPTSGAIIDALEQRLAHPSALVREHVTWALEQHHQQP